MLRFRAALFPIAALVSGVLIATLPPVVGALLLGTAAIALLAFSTPLTLLALLIPIAPMRVLIATEAPGQLPIDDIGQLALVAWGAAWVFYRVVKGRSLPRLPLPVVLLPIGVFTLALLFSLPAATSITTALQETIKWVQVMVIVVVIAELCATYSLRWLVFLLSIAGITHAMVGLYQFFGGSGALHLLVNGRYFRAFGTFGQPNPFGGFMGILAPVLIMAAFGQCFTLYRRWQHTRTLSFSSLLLAGYFAAAAALVVVGVFISYSRGAWLGFAASLGVITLSLPQKLWHSIALFSLTLTFGAGVWFADLVPQAIVSRLNTIEFTGVDVRGVEITTANYANVERLAHWQAALRMAQANPWFGVGAGNYEVAYDQYRLINWVEPLGHAHNYYLNILGETGIVGLVAYLVMWVVIVLYTWRARQHPNAFSRCVAVGLLGSWAYLAVHSLTDNLYVNNIFLYIGVLFGVLALVYRRAHDYARLEL